MYLHVCCHVCRSYPQHVEHGGSLLLAHSHAALCSHLAYVLPLGRHSALVGANTSYRVWYRNIDVPCGFIEDDEP